jgi:hypothetical protein
MPPNFSAKQSKLIRDEVWTKDNLKVFAFMIIMIIIHSKKKFVFMIETWFSHFQYSFEWDGFLEEEDGT